MKYLIAGATGFVGQSLVQRLMGMDGVEISILGRNKEKADSIFGENKVNFIAWDASVNQKIELDSNYDVFINLVGENLAKRRWTNERKKELYNSRIDGTKNLLKAFKSQKINIKLGLQISAIGIYKQSSELINEESPKADDFLGKLCIDWEKSFTQNTQAFERTSIFRLGAVLGDGGGAIEKMLPIFKVGLGGKLADGQFYMSWIHIHDLVSLIIKASTDEKVSGIFNATSHFPVTNKEFSEKLAQVLRKPSFFGTPKLVLKIVLGEMSQVVLANHKIDSSKLKTINFIFKYPTIETALKEVVSKK